MNRGASGPQLLTVIVPAHNPGSALARLLRAIDAQAAGRTVPVIVSDDGSSPKTVSEGMTPLSTLTLDVRVVRNENNLGPGAARNRGLAEVHTPWVAFIDADMLPGDGWLDGLLGLAAESDGPDGIEGRVVIPDENRATPFTHATDLSGPGGAGNIAYRTEVLRAEGGFDERYFDRRRRIHFREDTALHFRMVTSGRRVAWRPDIVAVHPPLAASYLTPLRLARRYYFDPMLSKDHPDLFRTMTRSRSVAGLSLRRAKHDFAVTQAASLVILSAGALTRRRRIQRIGIVGLAAAWPANIASLAWKRHVRMSDLPALLAMALVAPLVYLWHHTRGVIAFRHRPRY